MVTVKKVNKLLNRWENRYKDKTYDPLPDITNLADLIESEAEKYWDTNPDPFNRENVIDDDPPKSDYEKLLRKIHDYDNFVQTFVCEYLKEIHKDGPKKNRLIAACRLTVDILPGAKDEVLCAVEVNDVIVDNLYYWAFHENQPLQSYALEILSATMGNQNISNNPTRQKANKKLITEMLSKLEILNVQYEFMMKDEDDPSPDSSSNNTKPVSPLSFMSANENKKDASKKNSKVSSQGKGDWAHSGNEDEEFTLIKWACHCHKNTDYYSNYKNFSDQERKFMSMVYIYPLTTTVPLQQMFILRYLSATVCRCVDLLSPTLQNAALRIAFQLISDKYWKFRKLIFEALTFLSVILQSEKVATKFFNDHGILKVLSVPRFGIIATGVSVFFSKIVLCQNFMEHIRLLHHRVLSYLVGYAIWLLKCSHESACSNALVFLQPAFHCDAILEQFDRKNGVLPMFNVLKDAYVSDTNFIKSYNTDRQGAYNLRLLRICAAFKDYLQIHLCKWAHSIADDYYGKTAKEPRVTQAYMEDYERKHEDCDALREHITLAVYYSSCVKDGARWSFWDAFDSQAFTDIMISIPGKLCNYGGTVRQMTAYALECLSICAIFSSLRSRLREDVEFEGTGWAVLMKCAALSMLFHEDYVDVQKGAVNVLITCLSPPLCDGEECINLTYFGCPFTWEVCESLSCSVKQDVEEAWAEIRKFNGISDLLRLLDPGQHYKESVALCTLSCRALVELVRCEPIKQIISKLPLITEDHLTGYIESAIVRRKRQEYATFRKYGKQLMEMVTGVSIGPDYESLASAYKASIAAQTKIQYNEEQLHQIILQHLTKCKLTKTVNVLQREAKLSVVPDNVSYFKLDTIIMGYFADHHIFCTYISTVPDIKFKEDVSLLSEYEIKTMIEYSNSLLYGIIHKYLVKVRFFKAAKAFQKEAKNSRLVFLSPPTSACPSSNFSSTFKHRIERVSTQPSHLITEYSFGHKKLCKRITSDNCPFITAQNKGTWACVQKITEGPRVEVKRIDSELATKARDHIIELLKTAEERSNDGSSASKPDSSHANPRPFPCSCFTMKRNRPHQEPTDEDVVVAEDSYTLECIITEHLAKQHQRCQYPVINCAPFDLWKPHVCPRPKAKYASQSKNVAMRIINGVRAAQLDERFIHSRFCLAKTYMLRGDMIDPDANFSCQFLSDQQLAVGGMWAKMQILNVDLERGSKRILYHVPDHNTFVAHFTVDPTRRLIAIASGNAGNLSAPALYTFPTDGNTLRKIHTFENEDYFEFSNASDRLLGTDGSRAILYDVATGVSVTSYYTEYSNEYTHNQATFSPTNGSILSDGVLWDVNSGRSIHKFDKFNEHYNGKFHPNGLEILCNTEVWDVRTRRLFRTVTSLDQEAPVFSSSGRAIYSYLKPTSEAVVESPFFHTVDATDYTEIFTFNVKNEITHLAINPTNTQIATVESSVDQNLLDEGCSVVRIYDVGHMSSNENLSTAILSYEDDLEGEMTDDDDDLDNSSYLFPYSSDEDDLYDDGDYGLGSSNDGDAESYLDLDNQAQNFFDFDA